MKTRELSSVTIGASREFQAQRSDYHYQHLFEFWHSRGCPECGATELRPAIESAVDSVSPLRWSLRSVRPQGLVWDLDQPALTSDYPD